MGKDETLLDLHKLQELIRMDKQYNFFRSIFAYLKSLNGWVAFVSLDDGFDDFKGVLDVFVVDRRILGLFLVKGSDPSCITNGPVLKGLFGNVFAVESRSPLEAHGLTRVVETVLAVLHGVNVQQDGQAVGVGPLERNKRY